MKRLVAAHLNMLKVLVCVAALLGCVQTIPVTSDAQRAGYPAPQKRIPMKVGLYVRDDVRNYSYRWSRLGMILQMDVGEYLTPLSMRMASALFEGLVPVDSLPPYRQATVPDVDAVMEPEITYFYTDSTGALSGEIQSRIGIRINIYDLNGNRVWQGQAVGEASSGPVDLFYTYFQDRARMGELAQQAVHNALSLIADKLGSAGNSGVSRLAELKPVLSTRTSGKARSDGVYEAYFQQGMAWLNAKNYQQALRGFLRAERADPHEPYTKFYVGVCYAYSGQRQKAIEKFGEIKVRKGDSKLQKDTQKWIATLSQPLAIGLAVVAGRGASLAESETLYRGFSGSGMYEVVRLDPHEYGRMKSSPGAMSAFLSRLQAEGVSIVLILKPEETARRMESPKGLAGECASEFSVKIAAEAYSTKQKKLHSEFSVVENMARMVRQPYGDHFEVFHPMLDRGSGRALLKFLENDVI